MSARDNVQLSAPPHWQQHDAGDYRACMLCRSGIDSIHGRCCQHPAVAYGGQVMLVERARASTGPCGPEAAHLNFPGLTP